MSANKPFDPRDPDVGAYVRLAYIVDGSRRGEVRLPVVGWGEDPERGAYVTVGLGELRVPLPVVFDVDMG